MANNNQEQGNGGAQRVPVQVIRHGPISASIWENPGRDGTWWSVTFQRCYMDGKGVMQYSGQMNAENLAPLVFLAEDAHRAVIELRRAQRQADRDAKAAAGGSAKAAPQQRQARAPAPQQQSNATGDTNPNTPYDDVPY